MKKRNKELTAEQMEAMSIKSYFDRIAPGTGRDQCDVYPACDDDNGAIKDEGIPADLIARELPVISVSVHQSVIRSFQSIHFSAVCTRAGSSFFRHATHNPGAPLL